MKGTTDNDDVRWIYLTSIVTALLVITLPVLLIGASLGLLSLSAIGQGWFILYSTSLSMSLIWLYGEDVWKTFKEEHTN